MKPCSCYVDKINHITHPVKILSLRECSHLYTKNHLHPFLTLIIAVIPPFKGSVLLQHVQRLQFLHDKFPVRNHLLYLLRVFHILIFHERVVQLLIEILKSRRIIFSQMQQLENSTFSI